MVWSWAVQSERDLIGKRTRTNSNPIKNNANEIPEQQCNSAEHSPSVGGELEFTHMVY